MKRLHLVFRAASEGGKGNGVEKLRALEIGQQQGNPKKGLGEGAKRVWGPRKQLPNPMRIKPPPKVKLQIVLAKAF